MSTSLQRGKGVPVRKLQLLTLPFMEVLLQTLILSLPSKDGDESQISLGLVITSLDCSASAPFGIVPHIYIEWDDGDIVMDCVKHVTELEAKCRRNVSF